MGAEGVEVGHLTADAEAVAFLCIEAHPPCLRPLLQFVQVCLQLEMVLLDGDWLVEEGGSRPRTGVPVTSWQTANH